MIFYSLNKLFMTCHDTTIEFTHEKHFIESKASYIMSISISSSMIHWLCMITGFIASKFLIAKSLNNFYWRRLSVNINRINIKGVMHRLNHFCPNPTDPHYSNLKITLSYYLRTRSNGPKVNKKKLKQSVDWTADCFPFLDYTPVAWLSKRNQLREQLNWFEL